MLCVRDTGVRQRTGLPVEPAEPSAAMEAAQQIANLNLQISSDKLSLPEIARLVPALSNLKLQPSFNVKADGPLDALKLQMNVQSSAS